MNARLPLRTLKNKELVGAEIGVAEALHAEGILKDLDVKKLYLIDNYPASWWDQNAITREDAIHICEKRLERFDQVEYIRYSSNRAKKLIKEPLDFVFIDGNHKVEYVKQDIIDYLPLVKHMGLIAGHDFTLYDVAKAIFDYAQEHHIDFFNTEPYKDDKQGCWWFRKGEVRCLKEVVDKDKEVKGYLARSLSQARETKVVLNCVHNKRGYGFEWLK